MQSMQEAQQAAATLPRMPRRNLDHIPGSYGLPVIGHTLTFLRQFPKLVETGEARFGPVFRSNMFFLHGVTVLGPEANEFVLRDPEHVFSSRTAWNLMLERLFTNGLMLRDFADHKFHRRIMQQAFKKPALSSYLDHMNSHIQQGIHHWPQNQTFRFFDAIKSLLLSVGAQTFLGLRMSDDADKVNEAFVATVDATLAVMRLPLPGTTWKRGLDGRRYLEDFVTRLIPERRQGEGTDFFSQLCRAALENPEASLTDEDIMNHMIFLLFAAHDTTTSTLSSIIYALAKHPQWQQRLHEEMMSLDKDVLEYDDLEKLQQTGWVLRETLRMHPPLPVIPRRTVRDTTFNGYLLPRNTLVSVVPLHTHYMEDYWSHPQQFDPLRFSPERAEDKKHFYQWVPFGGGHHKCIGLNFAELQTKVFLFHFLKRYQISVGEGYKMKYQIVPLAIPKDGLKIRISPR